MSVCQGFYLYGTFRVRSQSIFASYEPIHTP